MMTKAEFSRPLLYCVLECSHLPSSPKQGERSSQAVLAAIKCKRLVSLLAVDFRQIILSTGNRDIRSDSNSDSKI